MCAVALWYWIDGVLVMSIFTDTITVYNHKSDDSYQRTVIRGVMYTKKREKAISSDGKVNIAVTVSITIPSTAKCDREYVDKRQFRQIEDTSAYWTLDESGNGSSDIIVQGEVLQEIMDDYRPKHLKVDHDSVSVAGVFDNRNKPRLRHVKVVCV